MTSRQLPRLTTAAVVGMLVAARSFGVAVTLTAPKAHSRFEVGSFIPVSASAEGETARVEFLANGTKIGESAGSPYTFVWTKTNQTGAIDVTARVVGKDGAPQLSAAVPIRIKATWEADPDATHAKTTAPLPYRIVSIYNARSYEGQSGTSKSVWDRHALIRRAAKLGYNGVMFQTAGGLDKLREMAGIIDDNGYIDSCHALGMDVTVWTTELTDVEKGTDVSVGNTALWNAVEERYETILTEIFPRVDGLVLRVTEGDANVSNPEAMVKLIGIVNDKCKKYGKDLIFRFFVHSPGHLENMLAIVPSIPEDVVIMPKITPQDWHMRSIADPSIGHTGDLRQIIEFDLHGEYWGGNEYPNGMVSLLKQQYEYLSANGAVGICARVDRDRESIQNHPSEVNMWALGLLATGTATTEEEIWSAFTTHRYGGSLAPAITDILRTGSFIRQESLYKIRFANPCGGQPPWDPHDWTDPGRFPWVYTLGSLPVATCDADTAAIAIEDRATKAAMTMAREALAKLETLKGTLDDTEYRILWRQLSVNNYAIISSGGQIVGMCLDRIERSTSAEEKSRLAELAWEYVRKIREQAEQPFVSINKIKHLGCTFTVDSPFPGPWNAQWNHEKLGIWVEETEQALVSLGYPGQGTTARHDRMPPGGGNTPAISYYVTTGYGGSRALGSNRVWVYDLTGRLVASPRSGGSEATRMNNRSRGVFVVRTHQGR